jgi:two-component system phosphate regulon sensor histidine kinase PhoR
VDYRLPVAKTGPSVEQAISDRAPVLASPRDLSHLPERLRELLHDVHHIAAVPLVQGGEVLAVLVVSRRRDRPFGQEERDTMMVLAGPAALAVRNSHLYARTQEASRVKTDFLDMAAHELRAPLTVITGYLSILQEGAFGPAPAAWEEPLGILDWKAAELRRLVDDLLLATQLDTGRLDTVLAPVDVCQVARQTVRSAMGEPELVTPQEPVMVLGDRDQLGRLLDQLVNNALAYSREGTFSWARVEVAACPDAGTARITVEDHGRGMAPDATEHIFERFSRIEDPDHPMVPGTGLGLYIARELAGRRGGRVELEWTEPGVGSRFALHLPLAQAGPSPLT